MGELFRSREMKLVQIYFQLDAVHDTLEEIGKHDHLQFRDLNPEVSAFQRNFVNEVKRTEEMHRTLRFFTEQIEAVKRIKPQAFHWDDEEEVTPDEIPLENTLDTVQDYFEDIEGELKEIIDSQKVLDKNFYELTEMKFVLEHSEDMFGMKTSGENAAGSLGHLTGMIDRDKIFTFEKLVWRVTRGNLFFRHSEVAQQIYNPFTNEYSEKNVVVLFYQGQNAREKMERLCSAFNASLYPCPTHSHERLEMISDVETRLTELRTVLDKSVSRQANLLRKVYRFGPYWKDMITKEKAIYHTMNCFEYDVGRRCLIAEGWCPTEFLEDVQEDLRVGSIRSGASVSSILSVIPTHLEHPTFQKTNDFTFAFQDIVDMYGIARYQEVNPGVFTIITFPFLFGVMFGDVGHGGLLLLSSLAILACWKFMKSPSETMQAAFDSKWLLLLMSLFSVYCGLMYNECFSLPMRIFTPNWTYSYPIEEDDLATQINSDYVYPFGVDPMWKGTKNELDYYNSLKMKMSVSIGFVQMTLGIVMSLLNHRYYKETQRIFCEFIPQILFLFSIFGYMTFIIFLKWTIQWDDAFRAPRILNLITEMVLSPWALQEKFTLFYGQHFVQLVLLVIAGICVPWMLLAKPTLVLINRKRKARTHSIVVEVPMVSVNEEGYCEEEVFDEFSTPHNHEDDEDISELYIHQGIHTIEFVLGCVSNTASYLRLWALSLAHSELSAVFWERVMLASLQTENFLLIFCAWSIWAVLTVGVLLGMESLSAFLHALRLHWVEFQNKFYNGDGYKFSPFSFKSILAAEDDSPSF